MIDEDRALLVASFWELAKARARNEHIEAHGGVVLTSNTIIEAMMQLLISVHGKEMFKDVNLSCHQIHSGMTVCTNCRCPWGLDECPIHGSFWQKGISWFYPTGFGDLEEVDMNTYRYRLKKIRKLEEKENDIQTRNSSSL